MKCTVMKMLRKSMGATAPCLTVFLCLCVCVCFLFPFDCFVALLRFHVFLLCAIQSRCSAAARSQTAKLCLLVVVWVTVTVLFCLVWCALVSASLGCCSVWSGFAVLRFDVVCCCFVCCLRRQAGITPGHMLCSCEDGGLGVRL